jgi:predicted small integral membrane protein
MKLVNQKRLLRVGFMDTATPRPMRLKIELTTAAYNALASSPFQLPAAKALATRLDMTRFSKV